MAMAGLALITGASTGIGAATITRLAGAGWTVRAGVRRPEDAERLGQTAGARPLMLDVTVSEDLARVRAARGQGVGDDHVDHVLARLLSVNAPAAAHPSIEGI